MITPLKKEKYHPLHEQLKSAFDLKETYVEFEIFNNTGEEYYTKFKTNLKRHLQYESIKNSFFFDDASFSFLKIIVAIPREDLSDIPQDRQDFYPICNKAEIVRIFEPQNNQDYLLQYRADQIISTSRLKKTFNKLMGNAGEAWTFEEFFQSRLFEEYLELLPQFQQEQCSSLASGFANSSSVNGFCMKVPTGSIVVISSALKYFLYYMNLFHHSELYDMEAEGFQAFLIAIRTMLGTESFDFEVDPRGEVPDSFHEILLEKTNNQLLFIIGHEYAHHYLGHLNSVQFIRSIPEENLRFPKKFFSYSQLNEFEADLSAILTPDLIEPYRKTLTQNACDFFFYIDIYQTVQEYIFPSATSYNTHPSPMDRIDNLNKAFPKYLNSEEYPLEKAIPYFKAMKEAMITDFLPFNIEELERYGSVYLNPELIRDKIDHIDY